MSQTDLKLPAKNEVFRKITTEKTSGTTMDFHEAMHFIEGRDVDERFDDARKVITQKLEDTSEDEEQATCNYYLLRLVLREHLLFENKEARDLYRKRHAGFVATEIKYKKDFFQMKRGEDKKAFRSQVEAFYRLVDSYLTVLEKIYQKKGFFEANERAYVDKMHFRKRFALFSGRHFVHLGHFFLDKTSHYGNSFGRWGITVVVFISLFAGIFAMLDRFSETSMFANYLAKSGIFDYFYFSIVTFTTLGYGDIVPVTISEKLIVGFEVLLGFTMLGILINLINKKRSNN